MVKKKKKSTTIVILKLAMQYFFGHLKFKPKVYPLITVSFQIDCAGEKK